MLWLHFFEALLILCGVQGAEGKCESHSTCSACVSKVGCAWCKQKDFLLPGEDSSHRCGTEERLRMKNCSEVMSPSSSLHTVRDEPLRDEPGRMVQLRPQEIHLKLRLGVPQRFNVVFRRAEGYPIDLYYLMDLSFSMRDDLQNVRKLGHQIVGALRNVSRSVRIGFGCFVEKDIDPYIGVTGEVRRMPCRGTTACQPAFSFRHVLPLTEDVAEFRRRAERELISSNLDNPEAGLDAVMQVAVCQDQIGWGNAARIVIYTSDDVFHLAGDGRLGGIVRPHDGKCHLDSKGLYDMETHLDYPSLAHVAEVLAANNIKLIFAVTQDHTDYYMKASEQIPQSVVGVLEEDSSNVVQLISKAYDDLSSKIILEHHKVPAGIDVSYESQCGDREHSPKQKKGVCNNAKINEQVSFTVTMNSFTCLSEAVTFTLGVQGQNEKVQVTVDTLCDCACNDTEPSSPQCGGKGTLNCGICSCDVGHMGQRCECDSDALEHRDGMMELERQCFSPNATTTSTSSQPCSGHGSCLCGQCLCRGHFRGQYCQCEDHSCHRHNNLICGGNGKCNCGTCECHPNFSGPACECSTLTDQCHTSGGGLCSHHGQCQCNTCQCHPGYYGERCSQVRDPCVKFRPCALCLATKEEKCERTCGGMKATKVNESAAFLCFDEKVHYNIKVDQADGHVHILYAPQAGKMSAVYLLICTASGGVVLIGVVVIIICKILIEISSFS
ncbi:integrin beta-7-like [Engraulis encrasicolus]|uniref:integrin beta-7-like n=1 Tax=Engraulis encrasicolus TaxID=184585 RepID=UPI002FD486C0